MSKILFGSPFLVLVLLSLGLVVIASSFTFAIERNPSLHSSAIRRNRRIISPHSHQKMSVPRLQSLSSTRQQKSLSSTPQQQCGWPYMTESLHHDFGPWTVKQLQYTLAGYLEEPSFKIDGVYGPETAALVRRFQTTAKIAADGATGPETWGAIQKSVYPLSYGAKGEVVAALQSALSFQGFNVNVTGSFDGQTVFALRNFQVARKDPTASDGKTATATTFHLLVTGCGSGGYYWADLGWPQGKLSSSTLSCLREQGQFEFLTFECWVEATPTGNFWPDCVDNIKNAYAAGFEHVGVYMFPQRYNPDTASQVRQLLGNLSANGLTNFSNVMFDIEGDKWNQYTHEENQQFILGLKNEFIKQGVDNIVVYCGSEWPSYFGSNFTAFSEYPVVYAHYDDIPSFVDFWPSYGGWNAPAGKQFWDGIDGEQLCGAGGIDWDWSAQPFWSRK